MRQSIVRSRPLFYLTLLIFNLAIGPFGCTSGQEVMGMAIPNQPVGTTLATLTPTTGLWSPAGSLNSCLTTANASVEVGTPVVIAPCDNSDAQLWSVNNGTFRLFGTKCLSVPDGQVAEGTALHISNCNEAYGEQKWTIENNTLVFANTYCLDANLGPNTNTFNVTITKCLASNNAQQWVRRTTFEPPLVAPTIVPGNANTPFMPVVAPDANMAIDTNEQSPLSIAAQELNALMPFASQSTYSYKTLMGTRFEKVLDHTLTPSEAQFFADASAQPPALGMNKNFNVILYPSGLPSPADVAQHAIGDCDGVSIMASLAYMNPEFIMKIVHDNGNNTYTVDMFDPKAKPIRINVDRSFYAYNDGTLAAASGQNREADWATVIEKAVMKYLVVWPITTIGGIGSEHFLPMLTGIGDSFAFDPGVLTPSQLRTAVQSALAQGMMITGGFRKEIPLGKVKTITAHGYAVFVPVGTDTAATMRNPWGWSPYITGSGGDATQIGMLNVPMTVDWSKYIDLRIIFPGAAASSGRTTPFKVPRSLAAALANQPLVVTEPHAMPYRGVEAN